MNLIKKISVFSFFVLIVFLSHFDTVSAQGIVPANCQGTDCQVNDFIILAINVANWILRVAGAFALLFFVYGGFLWITAMGNSSRVESGRNVLSGTVVAIVIILGAFTIVQFIGDSLGAKDQTFNKFLGSGGACENAGDACTPAGKTQNVYACTKGGTCSNQTLCSYWSSRTNNPYGITSNYVCVDESNSSNSSKCVSNLCSGGDSIKCCPK